MTSLDNPASARRMILARITSQYGDVYFRAMDSSVCRSSLERFMSNGLFLGISDNGLLMPAYQITSPNHSYKYVTVFANRSTKLALIPLLALGELDQAVGIDVITDLGSGVAE